MYIVLRSPLSTLLIKTPPPLCGPPPLAGEANECLQLRSPRSAFNSPHSAFNSPNSALNFPHSALNSPHSALNFPHSALRSQFLISPTYINVPLNAPFGLAELLKIWYNRMKVIMPHNAAGRRLCVYITAVRLYCFRSYTELRFEPAKGLNVIVGANAAGKTNILGIRFPCCVGQEPPNAPRCGTYQLPFRQGICGH